MVLFKKRITKKVLASQGVKVGLLAVLLKIIIIQTMLGWDKFLKIPQFNLVNFLMFAILGILAGYYMPLPLSYIKAFLIGFIATLAYNLSAAYIFKVVEIIPIINESMYGVETGILALGVYYILYRRKQK